MDKWIKKLSPKNAWKKLSNEILTPNIPFTAHLKLFDCCYPDRKQKPETAILWKPNKNTIEKTAIKQCMSTLNANTLKDLHNISVTQPEIFWNYIIKTLNIQFKENPKKICDLTKGGEQPVWLAKAKFNIVDSCLNADPNSIAVITTENNKIVKHSYAQLKYAIQNISASLINLKCQPNDAVALFMPMHFTAVASYLAIVYIGCIAIPIAESFAPNEIKKRLSIKTPKYVLTQEKFIRANRDIKLYDKIKITTNIPAILYLGDTNRKQDITWEDFLKRKILKSATIADAQTNHTILFSSGTTGSPKAIPWTHATPLKSASDALLHHNFSKDDIINWPTSLGWMMGPWLVFAVFINQATLALYTDTPLDKNFAKFIENTKVTVQGVVPTLVTHWRESKCLETSDWTNIRLFTSTGECSNPNDMLYLSSRAGYKPILEYCGGTEIGGAYISSTLIENNCPSVFTTPTMGSNFILLNEQEKIAHKGEVAIIAPAMGLSLELLNANHHDIYFAGTPKINNYLNLRRHGDYLERLKDGTYRALGRSDDTMNLSGIKVSATEIETVITSSENVIECAALVENQTQGPAKLLIYAVLKNNNKNQEIKKILQKQINEHLNPLFKIFAVIPLEKLPRTASGKIMRRSLQKMGMQKITND